jgi:hypothetical protein
MIRPENMPRRQRWLEPQANLMNIGVSFPSSSVQEFYQYGGTGGFGTPFVAPSWGYASNFPSSSSHTSFSSHVETVVKKEIPVAKKEVKKSEFEIYEELAFPKDYDSNVKDKAKIYDETAFSSELSRLKGKQSRLSAKVRAFAKAINDDILNESINKGDVASEKKDIRNECDYHREAEEYIIKKYKMFFKNFDFESKQSYAYNSISHHVPTIIDIIMKNNMSIEDVFFYSKEDNFYFMKDKYHDNVLFKKYLYEDSDLKYSNRHLLPQNKKKIR